MLKLILTLYGCLIIIPIVGLSFVTERAQRGSSMLSLGQEKFQTENIRRDGFDLYYRSLGTGEPILLLSGGPGDNCDYLFPLAERMSKYAHVILLEQRGTGRSMPPNLDKTTINLKLYLQDYEALRTHLKLQSWTVLGHSAGGLLAMNYAAAYPQRIHRLMLLDTAPVASELLNAFQDNLLDRLSMAERKQLASTQQSDSSESRRISADLQLAGLFYDRTIGGKLAGELSNAFHKEVGSLLGAEITKSGYDLRPQLKDFTGSVLVLNGRQDPMDPLMAVKTSAAFVSSTLTFINRAGHFPWLEQPEPVDVAIRSFLTSGTPSTH